MGQYYPFFKAYDVRAKVPDELNAATFWAKPRPGACRAHLWSAIAAQRCGITWP